MFRNEDGGTINSETKIEFTIGKFLALLGSIIGGMISVFVGFYFMVFQPSVINQINDLKEHNKELQEVNTRLLQTELKPFFDDVEEIKRKMGVVEGKVDGISSRFNDLNRIASQNNNSGGLARPNNP
jgi:hypothetical protein